MQLFLSGAESSSHLELLKECGVHRVAVSLTNLARHTAHYSDWASSGRLNGLDWVVYADTTTVPPGPVLELLNGAPTEPEAVIGPVSWVDGTWLEQSDILFLPLWDGYDQSILRDYLEMYDGVVLPDAAVDNPQTVRTAKAGIGPMQQVGGLTGRSKGIDRFDLLVSSAWWAVPKHGETQVWDGRKLIRLNSDDKHAKRQRLAEAIEDLGCDVSAILSDDSHETSKLAILSWLAMEKYLSQGRRASSDEEIVTNRNRGEGGSTEVEVVNGTSPARHANIPGVHSSGLPILPVMSTALTSMDEDGEQVLRSSDKTLLQCNTCILSNACPGYQQGASCHYSIPVEIRTKTQRTAVMETIAEIQTQRVLMGSFSEQVNGERDPDLGREMDRLFKMFKDAKDVNETQRLTMSMTATGDHGSSSGAISRLFGEEAGNNAQILDVPLSGENLVDENLG